MKIFFCDDHQFYSSEPIEDLEDKGHDVYYAKSYKDAENVIAKHGPFDCSFLDIILQNGKTGILLAKEYERDLGRIMFITGTPDKSALEAIERYSSASKLFTIYDKIDEFLNGGNPVIDRYQSGAASGLYLSKSSIETY